MGEITVPVEPIEAKVSIDTHLKETIEGSGRLVVVEGGLAAGKTSVLGEFVRRTKDREVSGAIALSAIGAKDEHSLGMGVVDQLLKSTELQTSAIERARTLLTTSGSRLDGNGTHSPANAATPGGVQFMLTVCDAFLEMAEENPLVIVVDNFQFADEWSVRFFLQLNRRIRAARILILLGQRDRLYTSLHSLHSDLTRNAHENISLAPLSVSSVEDRMRAMTVNEKTPEIAVKLRAIAAGNPLLVNALITDWASDGFTHEPVPGHAFTHAVISCLTRWDSTHLEIAQALAVLGKRASAESVAQTVGIPLGALTEVLDILTAAGLLSGGNFHHPAAARAVLNSLPPARRAALHSQAAELTYRRALPACEVARHLVAAGRPPCPWAVPVLQYAAEQATAVHNIEFAAACLELARSANVDGTEHTFLSRALARINWRRNPSATALHLGPLLASLTHKTPEPRDAVAIARHALWQGDAPLLTQAFDALSRTRGGRGHETRALLNLAGQWHFAPTHREFTDSDSAPRSAGEHGSGEDPWVHTARTLSRVWVEGPSHTVLKSAEHILLNCHLDDTTLEAMATAIVALAHGGQVERAERWCRRLISVARQQGAVTWWALLQSVGARIALYRGDSESALEQARTALGLLDNAGWGIAVSQPLTVLLLAHTARGAYEEAAKVLEHPVPEAMFRTVGGLQYLWARGRFHMATGRYLAAVSDFEQCRTLAGEWGMDSYLLAAWQGDLKRANTQLGYGTVLLMSQRSGGEDRTPGEGPTGSASLGAGLRIPAQRSASLAQPGPSEVRHPSTPDAWRGAQPAAEPQSESAGEASCALSDAEQRVAQLAVKGRTNRQIASLLFITVSTVEQHLTRVYRKLGVKGRSDLPPDLDALVLEQEQPRALAQEAAYCAEISTRLA